MPEIQIEIGKIKQVKSTLASRPTMATGQRGAALVKSEI